MLHNAPAVIQKITSKVLWLRMSNWQHPTVSQRLNCICAPFRSWQAAAAVFFCFGALPLSLLRQSFRVPTFHALSAGTAIGKPCRKVQCLQPIPSQIITNSKSSKDILGECKEPVPDTSLILTEPHKHKADWFTMAYSCPTALQRLLSFLLLFLLQPFQFPLQPRIPRHWTIDIEKDLRKQSDFQHLTNTNCLCSIALGASCPKKEQTLIL